MKRIRACYVAKMSCPPRRGRIIRALRCILCGATYIPPLSLVHYRPEYFGWASRPMLCPSCRQRAEWDLEPGAEL